MNGFEKRREEKEKQILEATFNLLNTNASQENITMEKIAKEAHVGKTTIFKYFDSKENLIRKVFQSYIEQLIEDAREIVYDDRPF
nr:TetR/AcrR family transcriptional regulator [Tetragenococcus muriaticus]